MDNIREKLVERLKDVANQTPPICRFDTPEEGEVFGKKITVYCTPFLDFQDLLKEAADVIANGVTVQEWIPVTDRLPKKIRSVLVCFDSGNMAVGYWYDKNECISFWQIWTDDGWVSDADCVPTHWMPLPQPPKGE